MKIYVGLLFMFFFSAQLKAQSFYKESSTSAPESNPASFNKKQVQLEVFPNPCNSGFLHVQLQNVEENVNISIYNVLGKQISSRTVEASGTFLFDVDNLPAGIYFVHLTTPRQEKIIKVQLH